MEVPIIERVHSLSSAGKKKDENDVSVLNSNTIHFSSYHSQKHFMKKMADSAKKSIQKCAFTISI